MAKTKHKDNERDVEFEDPSECRAAIVLWVSKKERCQHLKAGTPLLNISIKLRNAMAPDEHHNTPCSDSEWCGDLLKYDKRRVFDAPPAYNSNCAVGQHP